MSEKLSEYTFISADYAHNMVARHKVFSVTRIEMILSFFYLSSAQDYALWWRRSHTLPPYTCKSLSEIFKLADYWLSCQYCPPPLLPGPTKIGFCKRRIKQNDKLIFFIFKGLTMIRCHIEIEC